MSNFSHDPESLAKHLDNFMPPGQFVTPQTTGDPLIDAAAMFAQTSESQLSNEAMERIQARILSIHQAQQPVQQTLTARHPTQSRQARLLTGRFTRGMVRWGAVASFVCIVLLLGLTPAIANSLPGELFYPAKQAIEQIELTFARSPETQAIVHIQHAERRANEALALLERGQFKPELVEQALQDMRASADAARANGDSTALIALRGRTLQVDTALTFIMSEAQQIDVAFAATVAPLATSAQINRDNDALLLSTATVTITPSPSPSNTATTVLEATATPLPDTEVPTEPATERPTELPTELPTNVPETAVPEATLQLTDLAPDDQFIDFPIAIVLESMVDVVDGDI
ncbi:MAG: hypothetical protein H7175_23020, partial [Burkholderiales bacterium]|nr:hypothetical protein [Anaerolineae bacterium]